ncbi:MAG: hypothetical protein RJA63_1866 [Pseudomonadota bacterium]|jgi:type II secretory pathway predicted ATPase ExeA
MYKNHFGLNEAPFRITPHTGRFFAGAQRGAMLEALLYAIQHDEGIVRVTGEVGTGKTMLCRMLLDQLPDAVQTIYIANPSLTPQALHEVLRDELQVPPGEPGRLLRALEAALIERHAAGRKVVVIIDEAHAMPRESLEQIRLLSNLETSTHKLLQIALFGQPELNEMLAEPGMRSLRERITQSFELKPLAQVDIAAYLDFRLRAAGYKGPALFADAHMGLLARASRGLTRRLNILADKALLAAFADNTHTITPAHIRAAVLDAQFADSNAARRHRLVAVTAIALLVTLGLGVWLVKQDGRTPASETPPATPDTRAATPKTLVPAATVSAAPTPPAPVTPQSTLSSAETPALGPLALALLDSSRKQMEMIPGTQWFIQLRSSPAKDALALEAFIAAARKYLQADLLQLYVARESPGTQIGVVYGPFADSASAQRTLEKLPPWVRAHGAFLRRYQSLR